MGELAVITRAALIPQPVHNFSMSEIEHIATTIARGGLFGSKDPYAVATLCMLAHAEGQHPVSVFRDYHVISGKPSKKAEAMQRDFLAAGGTIEWHALTDQLCDATFSHPAGGSARITWDDARVNQAGLGSNPMHKKYPRQLKKARVVSEGVRTVFPGATSGLYVPEEVQDFGVDDRAPAAPTAQRARDLKVDAPALTDASPGRAKAEAWVTEHLAAVADASDHDTLDVTIAAGAKPFAKLGREHPDLREKVSAAYEARAGELDGYGKPDTDAGDANDDTTTQTIAAYRDATSEAALANADKSARVCALYDDPAVASARDEARQRLGVA